MKRITHKCACGAEAEYSQRENIESEWIDRQESRWLKDHEACRQAKKEGVYQGPVPSYLVTRPSPDPDECAEARAESLAGDHRETKEKAKEYAKWLANDASVPCLIYPCRVGGEDHWHVEKVIPDLIVFPSVSFMAQEIESARQQERERIRNIIADRKVQRGPNGSDRYEDGEWDLRHTLLKDLDKERENEIK